MARNRPTMMRLEAGNGNCLLAKSLFLWLQKVVGYSVITVHSNKYEELI
jgi:hypothetical protein